ncbi:MAG TPA: hypothetical protein VFU15_09205 [Bacteroidia bacterium]|nr:hypothetical protein [Bacteroidia bacterium]
MIISRAGSAQPTVPRNDFSDGGDEGEAAAWDYDELRKPEKALQFMFYESSDLGMNFEGMDSVAANVLIAEDHFTSLKNTEMLIEDDAYRGGSSGNCACFYVLVRKDSTGNAAIILSGTSGSFGRSAVKDITGDGIPEIVTECGITWMGDDNGYFTIFNFKNGKKNELFSDVSYARVNSGKSDHYDNLKKGDTISVEATDSILGFSGPGHGAVMSIRTIKTYNGGTSVDEIFRNAVLMRDTETTLLGDGK